VSYPYLDPNDAPWTDEYAESYPRRVRKQLTGDDDHSRYWCDETEDEYIDQLYGVV